MKRTFILESGVKTTSEAVFNFFNKVDKFYFALVPIKNHEEYIAVFESIDSSLSLMTTAVKNYKELLKKKKTEQYYRIETKDSVIQIWTDEVAK